MKNFKVFNLVYNGRTYKAKINVYNKTEKDIEIILDDLMNDLKYDRF